MTPTITDDELRDRLAPLAEHEPSAAAVAALRERAGRVGVRPRRRRAPRVAALGLAAAAGIAAVLLGPADPEPARPPAPTADVLLAAAAVADAQPSPAVAVAPLRYVRLERTVTFERRLGDRVAVRTHENSVEAWVGSRWRGREMGTAERVSLTGDHELGRPWRGLVGVGPLGGEAYDRAFAYGDGPLARLDPTKLPQERDALARVLDEGMRNDRWGPYAESRGRPSDIPEDAQRAHNAYRTILLLVYARLTGTQRAALLDVLAANSAARNLGTVKDGAGREGRGVLLDFPIKNPGGETWSESHRLIFDPATAEVLEWTMEPLGGAGPAAPRRNELVLETGWAQKVGERP